MEADNQHLQYTFSGFRLDPGQRRLVSPDGDPVPLTSRVFDTLLYLVAHQGELLDKSTLMQAVWPDTVVEENNLNQAISALRKALGEAPGAHQFILTEPGRGYRFVAEVQALPYESAPTSAGEQQPFTPTSRHRPGSPVLLVLMLGLLVLGAGYIWLHSTAPPALAVKEKQAVDVTPSPTAEKAQAVVVKPPQQSVAVLPFINLSPDQAQEYFTDGVAEEGLNQLSRIHGLYVAGRTSSFYFKGKNEDLKVIGEKLSVAHILEGSVRKDGNHVRITVQLVDVNDGYQLWSKSYDRNLEDIFAIQEDIARSITEPV